ncbi:hypothetical protein AXL3_59 [Stenotrophomonas phage vB_SmaS-AXL_3]|uniref:Uncharacterized protein n=1 Tax=Stenotrophomonas phage vB_SmaS-AXL_3 TaxID=2740427 RepID=A0A7D5BHB3_9CAUD|nr:hypothetical protein PQE62_gp59 [Stenotrophomonas phage vB_SmaS-AXL_3]QKW95619.1 hypothetical protein AXL3_59 [Stenotrophomonas phage vB_SmaS-AXL_3]
MSTFLKVLAVNVVLSLVLGAWYGWRQFNRRGARLVYIHERLDELDPGVRALSLEEEDERRGLLRELEEME